MIVFDKYWFKEHQKTLLYLCNHRIIKYWFRWILRIHRDVKFNELIHSIAPNHYTLKLNENTFKTDFRVHNKFSNRLYFAIKPFWFLLHGIDLIFNRYELNYSFGFDTLTTYSAAGTNSPVDGAVYRSDANKTFTQLRDSAGTAASATSVGINAYLFSGTTTNRYTELSRGFTCFDCSSLDDGVTITAAVLSYVFATATNNFGGSVCITEGKLSATNNVVTGDYAGTLNYTTRWATDVAITSITADDTNYTNFSFNETGISAISKTGVTTVSMRVSWDVDNTEPTWQSAKIDQLTIRSADNSGTTRDPKLIVTYTAGTSPTNKIVGIL